MFSLFRFSSAISKHWEAELATLKGNNAKLTAALLESTANVKQWKQQLAAYQEEAERLHKRVRAALPGLGNRFCGEGKFACECSTWTSAIFWGYSLVVRKCVSFCWVKEYSSQFNE